ncbi:MAG: TonB-dependent receptor, partial [Bryobacteraceae bacterium]
MALAAALLFGHSRALAQSTYGTIVGTITDPSGAVIPGAKAEARNQGTSAVRSIGADSQGEYRFVNMDPGTYSITVTAANFTTAEHKNVILLARETARSDFQLQVQSGGEHIAVTENQEVVSEEQTQSSSLSGAEINSLALNFRATNNPSPIQVAELTPGVNEDSSGNFTFSGQLPTATSFSIDGISTQLPRYGGPTKELFPSVEGISEFRVNTAGNSAEFSQPTDLTVTTKSGTNEFHGGAYWYLMRKDMNSADQISGFVPIGDANTFGVSFGGPVSIPKVYNGKDKTFFFFDYEGVRLDQTSEIATNTPPTAWRGGDFSGAGVTIVNPLTGVPFTNNQIPSSMINSVSAKIIPLFFPQPTSSVTSLAGGNNLVEGFPGAYSEDGFDGRLDHVFSANQRVWGRVTQKTISATGTDAALGALGSGDSSYNPLMGTFSQPVDTTNIAGSYVWIIKPNLVNELRAGYTRANFSFSYPQATQGDSIISSLGITGLPGSPKNGLGGVPVFYIGDLMGGATNPYGHPRDNKNGLLEIGDNISWVKGAHSVKFGFEFWRMNYQDNITFLNGDEYGDYYFNGANDAQAFANFLLGDVSSAYQAQNGPDGKPYGFHYGGFIQDEWHIRPNFTLNFGLRYEINTPFNDATNQLGNFDTKIPGGALIVQGQQGMSLINPLWAAAVGNTPFMTNSQVGMPDTLRYTYLDNIQ